ncbi:MAG: hypothetical protein L6Q37_00835 [Bdellovibrionaceae bacterium]|nr:hypothetical protein [Pseudobdellovibrionaceae bacterium]NUM58942.1 hypothetical protein [Pseudobdellovibrionaceae bacterium]
MLLSMKNYTLLTMAFFVFSFSSLSEAKDSQKSKNQNSNQDLINQANAEINESRVPLSTSKSKVSKNKTALSSKKNQDEKKYIDESARTTNNDNGILNVSSTTKADDDHAKKWGSHVFVQIQNNKGLLLSKKNTTVNLAQDSKNIFYILGGSVSLAEVRYLDSLSINLGFQQTTATNSNVEKLLLTQYQIYLGGKKSIYQQKALNISMAVLLGQLQAQLTSPDNGLANAFERANMIGAGLSLENQLNEKLALVTEIYHRRSFLTPSSIELSPITFTLGASYLW